MSLTIHWFRRDLRLYDNRALHHALDSGQPVLGLFILDANILDGLEFRDDARVSFIHEELTSIKTRLEHHGSTLLVKYGKPGEVWQDVIRDFPVTQVYTNRDYEPYAINRDQQVRTLLEKQGIGFHTFKDHVIFEAGEILKDNGEPYTVFTPFSKKWLAKQSDEDLQSCPVSEDSPTFYKGAPMPMPGLEEIGFKPGRYSMPPREIPSGRIRHYGENRDFPGREGTSRLGVHLRFGTLSIRELAGKARDVSAVWLNELIWREFYIYILSHFPHTVTRAFKPAYDRIPWEDDQRSFEAWCQGKTGYPIVDAGMRELNATGYMHNRVRMITASFLTKHLLIDWRWGEAYFAARLNDFELASNVGGWQWAAGCGTDAAPYFRIFNPELQTARFDPDFTYIRRWVPEFGTPSYPRPIIDHAFARNRCLAVYKNALG